MKLAPLLTLTLGFSCAASMAACGSSGVGEYPGVRGGGGPATVAPVSDAGGKGGSSSGSGGSSSGGGGSGSSSGGSSSGGDGGSTSFGNVNVAAFTLINASITTDPQGSPVVGFDPMADDSTLDLAVVGRTLSMRVTPAPALPAVGSMAFALDAAFTHVAETSPYSLCGDDGKGKFNPCPLPVGKHTLTVTTYPEADLGGSPYQPPTVFEFTVIDSSAWTRAATPPANNERRADRRVAMPDRAGAPGDPAHIQRR